MITRRNSFRALGVAALGAYTWPLGLLKAQDATADGKFINPLSIPTLYAGSNKAGSKKYELTLQKGLTQFFPNKNTETFGINGNFLGPTLFMNRDDQVSFSISNQLGEPTSLHWHGFHVPASEDGGPNQQIEPGDNWNPSFTVMQNGGTYWYHSHVLHNTGEQVYKGLAGMILVHDEKEDELGLPSEYGVDDIPLIVQDRRFSSDGNFSYMSRYDDLVKGAHGDTILVNGTPSAFFEPSTRLVRFRLLNAANARSFIFAFSDNREFQQIASDGGLLNEAVTLRSLELAPAERAEIIADFSDGQMVMLKSLAKPNNFPEFPGAMSSIMRSLNAQAFDILHIRPSATLTGGTMLPARLTNIERLQESDDLNVREFQLSMGFGSRSGDDRGPGTGARTGLGGGHGGGHSIINGRTMNINYINETIALNSTEIWELSNNSPMSHPFHVHHGQFQILDRNGQQPAANEMGWKDTVKVGSGERVRIIMRFEDFADPSNPYMYHCHILEHEDQGMMGQFVVI